jgi:hypothetical protein
MCLLLQYEPGYAYFCAGDRSEELRIDHTPYDNAVQGNNQAKKTPMKLYDNFVYTDPVYFLTRGHNAFVSVDEISIEMPLKLLSKNDIMPEDALDRMLVSNLRIKAIIEKYEQLQQQAQVLLHPRQTAAGPQGGQNHAGTGATQSLTSAVDIRKEKEKLGQILRGISLSTDFPPKDPGSDVVIVSNTHPAGGKNHASNGQSSPGEAGMPYSGTAQFDADISRKSNILLNQPDASLPWIFDRFLKTWKFVMDCRIEIITYMMLFLLVGFFISLRIKK